MDDVRFVFNLILVEYRSSVGDPGGVKQNLTAQMKVCRHKTQNVWTPTTDLLVAAEPRL